MASGSKNADTTNRFWSRNVEAEPKPTTPSSTARRGRWHGHSANDATTQRVLRRRAPAPLFADPVRSSSVRLASPTTSSAGS